MPISHHPLIEEFSEYKDTIHDLKQKNAHFRRLAHEYEGLDKSIVRAEQGIEIVNDDYLESIKKERLHLKDLIYSMLRS
jgi:uncharacterized protein